MEEKIPTLKAPKPHGKLEAREKHALGLLDPDGFAATYFAALEKAESEEHVGLSYRESRNKKFEQENVCNTVNREYHYTRAQVAKRMMRYLTEHDGQVDYWPDCSGTHTLSSSDDDTFTFHYFSDKYTVADGGIRRASRGLVYHNAYSAKEDSRYNGATLHREWLKSRIENSKEDAHTIIELVSGIGGVYLLFFFLATLCSLLFGLDEALVGLQAWAKALPPSAFSGIAKVLCTVLALPGIAYQYLDILHFELLAGSIIGAGILLYLFFQYRDDSRYYWKAKKEYREYIHSEQIQRTAEKGPGNDPPG